MIGETASMQSKWKCVLNTTPGRLCNCFLLILNFCAALFEGQSEAAVVFVDLDQAVVRPDNLLINEGDTVVWSNISGLFRNLEIRSYVGDIKSPLLQPSSSFSNAFNQTGFFPYSLCIEGSYWAAGTVTVAALSNGPPLVMINSPVQGFYFPSTDYIPLQASASDTSNLVKIDFFAGTDLIGTAVNAPYRVFFSTNVTGSSAYVLTAKVTNSKGETATSAPVNIFVESSSYHVYGAKRLPHGEVLFNYSLPVFRANGIYVSDVPARSRSVPIWHIRNFGTFVDEDATNFLERFYFALPAP